MWVCASIGVGALLLYLYNSYRKAVLAVGFLEVYMGEFLSGHIDELGYIKKKSDLMKSLGFIGRRIYMYRRK